MSSDFEVRTGTRSDIPRILELLQAALGETPLLKRTPDLFSWKHFDNPFGHSLLLVAEMNDSIVGVRALMRWDLEAQDGSTLRCLRAVDTATHPRAQGRGVFRTLTMSAVDEARELGYDMIFNTPNEKSAPGYLKMGWRDVGHIRPLIRPRLGTAPATSTDEVPELQKVIPTASPFIESAARQRQPIGLRTPRTSEYLSGRFQGHPTARYGWVDGEGQTGAVVRASSRSGRLETLISDLFGDNGLSALRGVARNHRARYAATAFSKGSPEHRAARGAGMRPIPGLKGLRLVANPLHPLEFDVHDLSSWDLAMSDLELL